MGDAERAYWSIVAQVAPVLALALVLEVRGFVQAHIEAARIIQRLSPKRRRRLELTRRLQVWMLFSAGVAIAFVTVSAVSHLRSDRAPSLAETGLAEAALGSAVVLVVLNPLLQVLMASDPAFFVNLFNWSPREALRVRRIARHLNKQKSLLIDMRHMAYVELAEISSTLEESQERLAGYRDRAISVPDDAMDLHARLLAFADRQRLSFRAAIVRELNHSLYANEVLKVVREARRDERTALTGGVHVDVITGTRLMSAGRDAELPDDGGFLHRGPPVLIPDIAVDHPVLVTDPSDLYVEVPGADGRELADPSIV